MQSKFVSICIPAFNQTKFLQRTLDSVLIQEFRDFEVIISDDSTTDEVAALVRNFEGRMSLKYFRNDPSLGSPQNWNRLLDLAEGRYIKFLHHDDWFSSPRSLSAFAKAVTSRDDVDFVFCQSEILNIEKDRTEFNKPSSRFVRRLSRSSSILFADNQIGAPSATMFRNSDVRFDATLKWLVDIDFYMRYLKGRKFIYLSEPLIVNTSGHEGQVTRNSQDRITQLGEYSYFYNKVFGTDFPPLSVSWFFIRLFRSYKVKDLAEVNAVRAVDLQPAWWFRLLIKISSVRNRR